MTGKYKSNYESKLNGGFLPSIPMPTIPIINPFTAQIQVANPVLPTINPTFNVYPRPLTLGPKINIFPNRSNYTTMSSSCMPKPICPPKKPVVINNPCTRPTKNCDINLIELLKSTKYNNNNTVLSPISDDLPSLSNFKYNN